MGLVSKRLPSPPQYHSFFVVISTHSLSLLPLSLPLSRHSLFLYSFCLVTPLFCYAGVKDLMIGLYMSLPQPAVVVKVVGVAVEVAVEVVVGVVGVVEVVVESNMGDSVATAFMYLTNSNNLTYLLTIIINRI